MDDICSSSGFLFCMKWSSAQQRGQKIVLVDFGHITALRKKNYSVNRPRNSLHVHAICRLWGSKYLFPFVFVFFLSSLFFSLTGRRIWESCLFLQHRILKDEQAFGILSSVSVDDENKSQYLTCFHHRTQICTSRRGIQYQRSQMLPDINSASDNRQPDMRITAIRAVKPKPNEAGGLRWSSPA